MTAEAVLTWKLFVFNWMLLAVMAAALALGVALTDFHVLPHGYLIVFAIAAVYGVLGYCNATSATRHNPRVCFILTAIAQMILVVAVMTSLTYVATAANLPLMDATLRAADVALGFDFRAYVDFVNDRPGLIYLLAAGYRSILVALPLLGHHRRAAEFICASICLRASWWRPPRSMPQGLSFAGSPMRRYRGKRPSLIAKTAATRRAARSSRSAAGRPWPGPRPAQARPRPAASADPAARPASPDSGP